MSGQHPLQTGHPVAVGQRFPTSRKHEAQLQMRQRSQLIEELRHYGGVEHARVGWDQPDRRVPGCQTSIESSAQGPQRCPIAGSNKSGRGEHRVNTGSGTVTPRPGGQFATGGGGQQPLTRKFQGPTDSCLQVAPTARIHDDRHPAGLTEGLVDLLSFRLVADDDSDIAARGSFQSDWQVFAVGVDRYSRAKRLVRANINEVHSFHYDKYVRHKPAAEL